jgi:hypothetical protein
MTLDPIVFDYPLGVAPARAFDLWAQRIGEWWPPSYSRNSATLTGVTIEPRVGGRVYARHSDTGEHDWGRVVDWQPGRRLAHSWTLAQIEEAPSEVAVAFAADGDGCALHFAHGGWNERNGEFRAKFRDWRIILDAFAAFVARAG